MAGRERSTQGWLATLPLRSFPAEAAFVTLLLGCGDGMRISLGDPLIAERDAQVAPETDAATLGEGGREARVCTAEAGVSSQSLLNEHMGFGAVPEVGCLAEVRNLDDEGPGSLRALAESPGPTWIVFAVSGTIPLSRDITLASDIVIDGRGQSVTLAEHGLTLLDGTGRAVIANLHFIGSNDGRQNDGVHLENGAHDVWVDHCDFKGFGDEAVGITRASTGVTVSWCRFETPKNSGFGMLIGSHPEDTDDVAIRVTLHHNHWLQVNNYTPRMRFGQVHFFNNFVDRWINGAAAVTMNGQLFLERNVFTAADNKTAVTVNTTTDPVAGQLHAVDNRLLNGAVIAPGAVDAPLFDPGSSYRYTLDAVDQVAAKVTAGAGPVSP